MAGGIDASIPLGGKDAFTSLSGMVNTMRGMQQLQTGQIEQQRQGVALSQEQGALDANRAFSQFMADHAQDPEYVDATTGLPNAQKFYMGALGLVDRNNPAAISALKSRVMDLLDTNTKAIDLRKSVIGLQQTTRNLVGTAAASIADDPGLTKKKLFDTMDFLGKTISDPALAPVIKHFEDAAAQAPDDPKVLGQMAANAGRLFMTPTEILSAQTPSGTQVSSNQQAWVSSQKPFTNVPQGQALFGTAVNLLPAPGTTVLGPQGAPVLLPPSRSQFPGNAAAAGPAGGQTQIPPEVAAAAARGAPFEATQAPGGRVQFQRGGPGGGYGGQQTALAPGEAANRETFMAMHTKIGLDAARTGEEHSNNALLLQLIPGGFTGTGAATAAKLVNNVGAQWVPGDAASNYQQMAHILAKSINDNVAASHGSVTDAQREINKANEGSPEVGEKALTRIVKINDAVVTGKGLLGQAEQKWMQDASARNGGQPPDIAMELQKFLPAWSKAYDLNALRLLNARGFGGQPPDKEEEARIWQDAAKSGSVKQLGAKASALAALIGPH